MDNKNQSQFNQVVDLIGDFICYWGFKKIHGQIWTLIFLRKEPTDANYIINQLNVSKGLVSLTIKDLLNYKVIEEIAKDKPSTQKYKINENIFEVISEILANREKKLLKQIDQACINLKKISKEKRSLDDIDSDNLESLIEMNIEAQKFLDSVIIGGSMNLSSFKDSLMVEI